MQDHIISLANLYRAFAGGDNWTGINAQQALDDIPAEVAVARLHDDHLNIAQLIAHLTCWNVVMARRLEGGNYRPTQEENFPEIVSLSAADWNDMRKKFYESIALLNERLLTRTDEQVYLPIFEGATSLYRNVYGQLCHLHYHLGQAVLLKKMLGPR